MLATAAVIIITLLCIAHFYLKSSLLASIATVMTALFAVIITFSYYEQVADLLISRGKGGQWAQAGCFIVLFIAAFAILRLCADFLVGANIDFGVMPTRITAVVSGIFVGLILSGTLVTAVAIAPLSNKMPYNRFPDEGKAITAFSIRPNGCLLNADGFVAGLFGWMSKGSLSSGKSFAVYHPDFVNELHLNGLKAKEKVAIIAGKEAVSVAVKNGVRIRDDNRTVIRLEMPRKDIAEGGAMDADGKVNFTLSQIRLICTARKQTGTTGSAEVHYPEKYQTKKNKTASDEADLSEIITFNRNDFKNKQRVAAIELAFDVPKNLTPILLAFKENTIIKLPKAVADSKELQP